MAKWALKDLMPGTMFTDKHFLGHRIFLTITPWKDEYGNLKCLVHETGEVMYYKPNEAYQPVAVEKYKKADADTDPN